MNTPSNLSGSLVAHEALYFSSQGINQRIVRADIRAAKNNYHQIPHGDAESDEESNEASSDC